jgi:hypothetical protein
MHARPLRRFPDSVEPLRVHLRQQFGPVGMRKQPMSKIKTPQDKKRLSYQHDRRNTYGENHKSSRKNIPRSKQLSHQDERRAVRQALIAAHGGVAEDAADEAQSAALRQGRIKKLRAFRKSPDRPLGEVVARRLRRGKDGNGP